MLRVKLGLLLVSVVCLAVLLSGCGSTAGNSQQNPSFTLSAQPSTLSIAQGSQGTSTITITPQNGFTGSVNLSAPGLPSGVTAGFNPNPATTTSTLTLKASATATTGTSTATISGTSGNVSNSTTISLTVTSQGQGSGKIKHVVIIFQENRSPDNLFHDSVLMNRGADIASQGKTSTGQIVTLTPVSLGTTYDLGHSHGAFLDACDYNPSTNTCAMDGADLIPCSGEGCPAQYPQYQYVQQSDVQPYWTMAETYTFGDRMFQTNMGPSFPAHQYILAGTSTVCVPGASCPSGATSTSAVADNPGGNLRPDGTYGAGCLAPPGAFVNFIDTSQASPESPTFQLTDALCAEHPTLTDLLDAASLSWKYYAPNAGSIWTAPDGVQHMCVPSPPYPSETSECTGADWTNHVDLEGSHADILTDIGAGQLAAVSWVIPAGQNSDHAGGDQTGGPSWVANIVNAIGTSTQYWTNEPTAIIVAWDDWGGWFDHQPPLAIRDSYEYGLRVPLIVISPYAKPAYITHLNHDFGSILRFVETTFGLGLVGQQEGLQYADARVDNVIDFDLSDCFDFSQTPLQFTKIPAPLDAKHFLNDNSPPAPPDDY